MQKKGNVKAVGSSSAMYEILELIDNNDWLNKIENKFMLSISPMNFSEISSK